MAGFHVKDDGDRETTGLYLEQDDEGVVTLHCDDWCIATLSADGIELASGIGDDTFFATEGVNDFIRVTWDGQDEIEL